MNKKTAKEIADKIRAFMDQYPDLIYGIFIYDDENAAASSNYCLRCINELMSKFLDESDIKHDIDYDVIEGMFNDNEEIKH